VWRAEPIVLKQFRRLRRRPVLNEWAVGQSFVICLDCLGEGMATFVLVHGAWHGAWCGAASR
jgi:hypothetical protein